MADWANTTGCSRPRGRQGAMLMYRTAVSLIVEHDCAHVKLSDLVRVYLEDEDACFGCLQNLVEQFAVEGVELRRDMPPDCENNYIAVLSALSECAHACMVDAHRPVVTSQVMSQAFGPQPIRKA